MERENPLKSRGKRTVVGKIMHESTVAMYETKLESLRDCIDALDKDNTRLSGELSDALHLVELAKADERITKACIKDAENAVKYHERRANRAELIIDKLVGYEQD